EATDDGPCPPVMEGNRVGDKEQFLSSVAEIQGRDAGVGRDGAWLASLDVPDGDRAHGSARRKTLAIRRKGELTDAVPGAEASALPARRTLEETDVSAEHNADSKVLTARRKRETRGRVFPGGDAMQPLARLDVPDDKRVLRGVRVAHHRRAHLATGRQG